MKDLSIKTASSIHDIDAETWDQVSAGRSFQSHRWYAFGEQVMSDCASVYLLVYEGDRPVARATLWLIGNEPLPRFPAPIRALITILLQRWPLLICRSPLSSAPGLVVPDDSRREAILSALAGEALKAGRQWGSSFVLFDFLNRTERRSWPSDFVMLKLPSPGTIMENRWQSLEDYLACGNKRDRQHYKRTLREADKLGVRLTRHKTVTDVDAALALIRNVERRYASPSNPWMRRLLENIEMVDATWLEARIDQRLVGCGLILEDNRVQMTMALGLAENVTYIYFLLVYASLEAAFEKRVRFLRLGTGAYDVKQRLGFELEQNNYLMVAGANKLTASLSRKLIASEGKHDLD